MIKRIKAKLYSVIFWQTRLGEVINKLYDVRIFISNSFSQKNIKSKKSFEAFLTKQYHIIEKGLALPNPRKGFGIPKIEILIHKTELYINRFGEDRITQNIKETLNIYIQRNHEIEEINPIFFKKLNSFINGIPCSNRGGVKKITKKEILKAIDFDFENFVKTRTSVRNFSAEEVMDREIFQAVENAKYTPSVCNRQSWKVHLYKERKLINQLLKIQNGSNGFSESINKLLVITTDTKKFTKLESNQVFVDGGLFSMTLLLSLHALKIGSCCLNTCLPYVDEKKIKKIGRIPNSERLIMMIGVGKYKDSFEVAISDRITVNEIVDAKLK